MRTSTEHRETCCAICLIGWKNLRIRSRTCWTVVSGKHSIETHFPKDPSCKICNRTKITMAPCKTRTGKPLHRAESLGDLITADHKTLSEFCEPRNNHRYAVLVQDLATQWISIVSMRTKTSQKFLEFGRS